jgi:hypothetical protein
MRNSATSRLHSINLCVGTGAPRRIYAESIPLFKRHQMILRLSRELRKRTAQCRCSTMRRRREFVRAREGRGSRLA